MPMCTQAVLVHVKQNNLGNDFKVWQAGGDKFRAMPEKPLWRCGLWLTHAIMANKSHKILQDGGKHRKE